LEGTLKII